MKLLVSSIIVAGILGGISLVPGDAASWTSFSWAASDRQADARYVTAMIGRGRIARTITATGSLQAVSTVAVSSQLSGQIAQLNVDYNDAVNAGQPLAALDQRGYRARIAQAEAELEMARQTVSVLVAKLEKAVGVERETVVSRKVQAARIEKAGILLEAAIRTLTLTETLARRGTKSKTAVEDARSDRLTAEANLREAEAAAAAQEHAVATSRAGRREAEAELANARAALPLRWAALSLAELDLDRSTIRAPIKGIIINRTVEKGQTVAASLDAPTLFTIAGDLSEMEIHANVDETDIGQIRSGQAADFNVDAFPGRRFPARVTEVRKGARRLQGVVSYTVVLRVGNPEGLLLPGMTAKIGITIDAQADVLTLPLAALRFSPSDAAVDASTSLSSGTAGVERTVWLLSADNKPWPQKVRVGIDDGRDAALLDGELAAGQAIITGNIAAPAGRTFFGIRF